MQETRHRVEFPPNRSAPRAAREFVDEVFAGESGETRFALRLLASELVTNSVRHARLRGDDRIGVTGTVAPSFVRLEVTNRGSGFVPPRRPHDSSISGRGLAIARSVSDRFGISGKRRTSVWAELDRRREPRRAGSSQRQPAAA